MGIRAAMAQVIAQVQQTTPTFETDVPFRTEADATGTCVRLEDLAGSGLARLRMFDVRLSGMPQDDGAASGGSTLRFSADLVVRVYYDFTPADRTRREQMAGEDVASIMRRLSDPSNWDRATTDIDCLVTEDSAPSVDLINDETAAIVGVPIRAIYWE